MFKHARLLSLVWILWAYPVLAQDKTTTVCSCEAQFTNCRTNVNPREIVSLSLFSSVSQGTTCLPADIRISAAFYDSDENLICSGVISDNLTTQGSNIQMTNLNLLAFNPVEFVRLRSALIPAAKRFFCMNPEGNGEVSQSDIVKAATLRFRATVLPKGGAVATTECRMSLNGR